MAFLGAVLLSYGFMWGFEMILNNGQIIRIVTVYLKRSLSLTGRTIIYTKMAGVMKHHWLLGYGYGSTYEICYSKIGFADTQNALMEWIMQIGIVGTLCLVGILVFAFSISTKVINKKQWIWFGAYVYTMVFIGTVEITYTMYFFGMLVWFYMLGNEQERRILEYA